MLGGFQCGERILAHLTSNPFSHLGATLRKAFREIRAPAVWASEEARKLACSDPTVTPLESRHFRRHRETLGVSFEEQSSEFAWLAVHRG